jgi:hypothetical protein
MKERTGLWPAFLRLLGGAALIDVGIFGLAGLFCWLIGWRTWFQYGRAVVIGGLLCAGIGAITLRGGLAGRNPDVLYIDSMGQSSPYARTKRLIQDAVASRRFTVLLVLAGLVAAVVGFAIVRAAIRSLE